MSTLPSPAPYVTDPEIRNALEIIWRWAKDVESASALTTELVKSPGEPGLKIIRGIVTTATGATVAGAGWTGTNIAAGRVHIDYTTDFSAQPAVAGNCDLGEVQIILANTDASGCRLVMTDSAGTPTDGTIHFIAVGPA